MGLGLCCLSTQLLRESDMPLRTDDMQSRTA